MLEWQRARGERDGKRGTRSRLHLVVNNFSELLHVACYFRERSRTFEIEILSLCKAAVFSTWNLFCFNFCFYCCSAPIPIALLYRDIWSCTRLNKSKFFITTSTIFKLTAMCFHGLRFKVCFLWPVVCGLRFWGHRFRDTYRNIWRKLNTRASHEIRPGGHR